MKKDIEPLDIMIKICTPFTIMLCYLVIIMIMSICANIEKTYSICGLIAIILIIIIIIVFIVCILWECIINIIEKFKK